MDAERPSEQLIGGDKDSHDCLIAADYSWCEVKQKCLRTWEEKCEVATTTDQTASWKTYRNDKYGYEIKYPEDFFWMYSNPNTPDPARMNFVEIVNFSDKTKSLTIDTLYPDEELKNRTLSSHPNLPALKWDNLMRALIFHYQPYFEVSISDTSRFAECGKHSPVDQKTFDQILSTFRFTKCP